MDKCEEYEIYSDLSQEWLRQGNSQHKRKTLHTRILKLQSQRSYWLYFKIGTELLDSGKFQESLAPLKRATILVPRSGKVWISLAKAFFKLEKENEAVASIKKALCISPGDFRLHSFVISILEERNRLEDLGSFYKEIEMALIKPESVPILYYEIAQSLVSCNKYLQSFEMYKRAVEAGSTNTEYYYDYAMALYHEGVFEEAVMQFEHVMKLNPTDKLACNNIAFISYCLGRVDKAREKYEEIIEKGFQINATYSNFILVLSHLDQDEEVIEKYKGLFMPYIQSDGDLLRMIYKEAVRITEVLLQKDDIDEGTREFNTKKLKGVNFILSLLD